MKREVLHGGMGAFGTPPRWAVGAALAIVVLGVPAVWAGVSLPRVGVLLVLAPLAEEVIFRAGLHESLLRRGGSPWLSIVLTALTFGAAHVALRGEVMAFAVAAPALLIGLVYQRARRVWPCVALHAAMNALWLGWGLAA